MKCPHCGKEHPNQAIFCPETGSQIISFECPRCGEVLMAGSSFCTNCSLNLLEPTAPPPSDATAPVSIHKTPFKERLWLWIALLVIGVALLLGGFYLLFRVFTSAQDEIARHTPIPTRTITPTPTPRPTLTPSPSPTITPTPGPTLTPTEVSANVDIAPPADLPECITAGQTYTRQQDGMVMVCVPAGSFTIGQRSCGYAGCEKEVNGGTLNLPAFWIDRSEVTNAMFAQFVAETNFVTGAERTGASAVYGFTEAVPAADWRHPQGLTSSINGLDDHPAVQLNWFAANAYCQRLGGQLPSEAQWEKAARGSDGRLFPWGNDLPKATFLNAADANLPVPWARADQDDGFRYTSPAGSFPAGASPFGVLDLAGNAWEWTRSLFRDYPYTLDDGRELSAEPGPKDKVTLRGGCWYDDYGSVRATLRYGGLADQSTDGTGFRCVFP